MRVDARRVLEQVPDVLGGGNRKVAMSAAVKGIAMHGAMAAAVKRTMPTTAGRNPTLAKVPWAEVGWREKTRATSS